MGITSKQIAELVGVSRGTVDRALHRRGGVKPEIQRRVEMLAREYGYRPDRAGKALVTREPLRVGVILNSKGNPFYEEVRRGLTEALGAFSDFPSTWISGNPGATAWRISSPPSRKRRLPAPQGCSSPRSTAPRWPNG